jgi:hypothetical protein
MKQEILEEVAENRYVQGVYVINGIDICEASRECFIEGAKWQQERSYSEEEVCDILFKLTEYFLGHTKRMSLTEWFEQFKKK